MKPVVFYHANCADGFGAAFAAWMHLGDTVDYVPIQYGEYKYNHHTGVLTTATTEVSTYGNPVYILDFSFPKDIMDKLFETAAQVTWLDHHKSAFEMYGLVPNKESERGYNEQDIGVIASILLDNQCSGALLAWKWFIGGEAPLLIKHLDDYDRWQFKIAGTKEFNKALWSRPFSFDAWKKIYFTPGYEEDAYEFSYREGEAILRAHDQNVQSIIASSKMPCSMTWYETAEELSNQTDIPYLPIHAMREVLAYGLAANCPKHLSSDVGHVLATESGTYGLCWVQKSDSMVEVSLRSNGDYDVSAIAKKFGGGGHKNAAGFKLTMSQLQKWFYPDRRHGQ